MLISALLPRFRCQRDDDTIALSFLRASFISMPLMPLRFYLFYLIFIYCRRHIFAMPSFRY